MIGNLAFLNDLQFLQIITKTNLVYNYNIKKEHGK